MDGKLFFARQDEIVTPRKPPGTSGSQTKQDNLKVLNANAAQLEVAGLLDRAFQFLSKHLSAAYSWPGKWSYSFSLPERTEQGNPTLRSYVNLYMNDKESQSLQLVFQDRAVRAAGSALDSLSDDFEDILFLNEKDKTTGFRMREEHWPKMAKNLEPVLASIIDGWKAKTTGPTDEEPESDGQLDALRNTDTQSSAV